MQHKPTPIKLKKNTVDPIYPSDVPTSGYVVFAEYGVHILTNMTHSASVGFIPFESVLTDRSGVRYMEADRETSMRRAIQAGHSLYYLPNMLSLAQFIIDVLENGARQ